MEGDPLIKSRIREKQRKMAMQRMMQEVPKADVVITNPTHFAVAIKYDAEQSDAPVVVAKGMDYVALKIREIAEANGVIQMENKPLARALYNEVEIGQTIPAELFQAVAEVLAYVYKLKGKTGTK
jgi:flagellar biosynthetic protein FlhB